eukprot:1177052-Prorocentrum_minimum.AAC.1
MFREKIFRERSERGGEREGGERSEKGGGEGGLTADEEWDALQPPLVQRVGNLPPQGGADPVQNIRPVRHRAAVRVPANRTPTAQRAANRTHVAQRAANRTPTAQRAANRAPTANCAANCTPTAQRTANRAPTAHCAANRTPTAQRTANRAPTAQRAANRAPTAHCAANHMPTAQRAAHRAPTAHCAANRAPTAQRAANRAPTAQRAGCLTVTLTASTTGGSSGLVSYRHPHRLYDRGAVELSEADAELRVGVDDGLVLEEGVEDVHRLIELACAGVHPADHAAHPPDDVRVHRPSGGHGEDGEHALRVSVWDDVAVAA